MKKFKNYHSYGAYYLNIKFQKEKYKKFNGTEFENSIKNMVKKDKEEEKKVDDLSSKIWQFDEYSKESPVSLKEAPDNKKNKEEKEDEKISDKFKINEDILNNNKIELDKVGTINEIIELFKKSSILAQLFPFLIGKINNDEARILFNNLYSIYITYKKYDKSIISEDSVKYCKLFEKICKDLIKYKLDLDDFEEIKKLSIKIENDDYQSTSLLDYPKPKVLNIPKDFKWFKSNKEKSKYERINWEAGKIEKEDEGEFVMKQKITDKVEKNRPNKTDKLSLKSLQKISTSTSITFIKKDEEEMIKNENLDDDNNDEEFDSDEEDLKYEKETGVIEEVGKDKIDKMKYFKDDKSLTKQIISSTILAFPPHGNFPDSSPDIIQVAYT